MKTILIIDDSPRMLATLNAVLGLKGYQTIIALNAASALDRLSDQIPDLILLDMMMPGMSGVEFLKVLHRDPRWKDIPVIVVSAREDYDQEVRRLGVRDYLVKSRYSNADLLAHVRNHLSKAA